MYKIAIGEGLNLVGELTMDGFDVSHTKDGIKAFRTLTNAKTNCTFI
jgi:hypothetical protein